MRKILSLALLISFLFCLCSCGNKAVEENIISNKSVIETTKEQDTDRLSVENAENAETDVLSSAYVVYFSRADENYGVGNIEKGNTQIVAEMIGEQLKCDTFHIETVSPYPSDYDECTEVAKRELSDNARPELTEFPDLTEYDTIFVGYPIWWGDMPMAMYTFLEHYDWNGKTIVPFVTHAGSGMSGTADNIRDICTGADVLNGLAVTGETAQNDFETTQAEVSEWLEKINIE